MLNQFILSYFSKPEMQNRNQPSVHLNSTTALGPNNPTINQITTIQQSPSSKHKKEDASTNKQLLQVEQLAINHIGKPSMICTPKQCHIDAYDACMS